MSATVRSSPDGLGTAASSRKSVVTSESPASTGRSLRRRLNRAAHPLTRADERGADELAEERRRTGWARLELRMELAGHEPRVVGELDDLDEPPLLERAGDHEPALDEPRAEVVVDLVAVAVTLVDHRLAIGLARASA